MKTRLLASALLVFTFLQFSQSGSTSEITGKEVTYLAGDTTLKDYLAWDSAKSGKRPAVLVVHEWWGHNDYARERARQLAALGYLALAVDMYGDGKSSEKLKALLAKVF